MSALATRLVQIITVYRTVKMVKIYDKKLILVHQTCLSLAFIYALFYFILGHAYFLFESPHLTVSTTLDNYNNTAMQELLAFQLGNLTAPDYCNMTGNVHWDFDTDVVWEYPQCISYLGINEFTSVSPDSVWVYTNFWQRVKTRTCDQPPTTTNVSLVDPDDTAVDLILLGQNCSMDTTYYMNAFVFHPEDITLEMKPVWGSSWQSTGTFDQLTLMTKAGAPYGGALSSAYTFWGSSADLKSGAVMKVSLGDLLDAAGVDLDAQNVNSGGKGLETGFEAIPGSNSNSATTWPSYRNTGVVLRAKLRVANYRQKQPINFNVTGELFLENASPGGWASPPSEINYWGDADENYDSIFMERRYQGVRVSFTVEGYVGVADTLTTVNALLNMFVIGIIAIAVTDLIAQQISEEFAAEKFEDDGERAAVDALLEKEADHGVPFNFEDLRLRQPNGELSEECYESAIFRLEKEIEELRQGGARVKSAAAIIAEDIGLPGLLDDNGPPPEPVYKLIGDTDVILLYPGDNVIGRGLGDIKTPTVSRKQLCITVDPDSKRAFIRSMRADKAPSVPAIMRSSSGQTNWRALNQKGQSLNLGDTICMQIRPAPLGKEPGRLNEYRFVSLEAPPPPEPTFLEKLKAQYKIPFL